MKIRFVLFCLFALISCDQNKQGRTKASAENTIKNNSELKEIYEADQADRQTDSINWNIVFNRDRLRRTRVLQLIDSNKVRTTEDYHNAAMIFQHGTDSTDYKMAVDLMSKAIELDSGINKWLFAAATDRYLLSIDKPQIYGTQYIKRGNEPWKRAEIDTTQISDEERVKYRVETLSEQKEKVKRMNQKN